MTPEEKKALRRTAISVRDGKGSNRPEALAVYIQHRALGHVGFQLGIGGK